MVPFAGLPAALERMPDPRRPQGRRYGLAHLLLFSVLAVLTGATSGLFGSGHERFVRAGPAAEGPAGRRSC